jgi:predicted dehydrogenase
MRKLTGVIIGCGAIAREHLRALEDLKNVEVAAVCDISPARAEATAGRFGVLKWYLSYQQMLADIRPDLVHITTPPSSHFQIAKSCLAAGLNILCEKPITVNYQEFDALKKLSLQNRCMLMENQNLRFHSVVRRIDALLKAGELGDILDVQVNYALNIFGPGVPYTDPNVPHFGLALRGGVIGDFLTHIACLAHIFAGSMLDLRTIWTKHTDNPLLPADEFRAVIKGERAPAYVAFSGNTQLNGLWLRVSATRMHAETNLFEPPRLTLRRSRSGEPALMNLFDGIIEARDVLSGTIAGFWRKLSGVSSYDGLSSLIERTYHALELGAPPPISLDEIDSVAHLVDSFTKPELKL